MLSSYADEATGEELRIQPFLNSLKPSFHYTLSHPDTLPPLLSSLFLAPPPLTQHSLPPSILPSSLLPVGTLP